MPVDPTAPGAEVPPVEAFNAGRDLAHSFIRAAIAADASAKGDRGYAEYSTGILRPFLARLQAQPELIDGFDAYMTAIVGVLEHSSPNVRTPWLEHGHVYGPDRDWFEDAEDREPAPRLYRVV